MTADVRFTDEALAFEQPPLWPDGWAIEPPPADTDDTPQCRPAWSRRRRRRMPCTDLPDIATYRAA